MKIKLGEADRERFGCPEWLDLDLESLSVAEAEAIDEAGGDWSIVSQTGAKAAKTRVWLALYRAGVKVSLKDLEFNLMAIEAEEDPGKAPSAANGASTRRTSASSTRSRRPRSKTSS